MKSQTVPSKRTQGGFTLVEIAATIVIVAVVGAYAAPRMMGTNDVAAKVTADRVLAALHYAQTLAQRQGVVTEVEMTPLPQNRLIVRYQAGPTVVTFTTQNWDGSATAVSDAYDVNLHPDALVPAATIRYGAGGILTAGAGTYTITYGGLDSFRIKVEPTGAAHFE